MRAAVYRRYGPPEVVRIEEIPTPSPRPGAVLIKVHASTLSAADHRARSRNIPTGLRVPAALSLGVFRPRIHSLGMDAAGVVAAVGKDVTAFTPGDEVTVPEPGLAGQLRTGRRTDSPRRLRFRGRTGAWIKEAICRMTVRALQKERFRPGAYKTPKGPRIASHQDVATQPGTDHDAFPRP